MADEELGAEIVIAALGIVGIIFGACMLFVWVIEKVYAAAGLPGAGVFLIGLGALLAAPTLWRLEARKNA